MVEPPAQPAYPTPEHEQAAHAVVDFFSAQPEVETVLLVNSLARGKGSPQSDLDIVALVSPGVPLAERARLEHEWNRFYQREDAFRALQRLGPYTGMHEVDIIDGNFTPSGRDWTSGPDSFELEIGNTYAYSYPLYHKGDYFAQQQARWLPYYGEQLRQERLAAALKYCRNNLGHIPLYVGRALYFQAFDRLYNAFKEFLQALFISRRVYPIAYDKWIREQIVDILGLPDLYRQLPHLLEIRRFESQEIAQKGGDLERLLDEYAGNYEV